MQRIKLVPKGEFPHSAGVVQVIDDLAIQRMAETFDDAQGILIDFDHYSDLSREQREAVDAAKVQLPSEAAGWVKSVETGADGLYGTVEWTPDGENALASGRYRFRSPVFRRRDLEIMAGDRVRPLALSKVGLTNEPNMRAMPALANAAQEDSIFGPLIENRASGVDVAEQPPEKPKQEKTMDYKSKLLAVLGLPADASDDQIEEAIRVMKAKTEEVANAQTEAEKEKERLENENKELDEEKKDLENRLAAFEQATLKTKVDAALKEHEAVITNREAVEQQLTKDFDGTLALLKGIKTLPNRADGNIPDEGGNQQEKPKGLAKVAASFKK